jgi:hypothetical protein
MACIGSRGKNLHMCTLDATHIVSRSGRITPDEGAPCTLLVGMYGGGGGADSRYGRGGEETNF